MGDIYLVLQNKMIFKGKSFGASGSVTGEIVFTTGMGGYIETLSDNCYRGQIVVATFPLGGNYGVMKEDMLSSHAAPLAYIVREYCLKPSNFRCELSLDEFLKQEGVVGVCDLDTRELTKVIRENGVMNALITDDISSINYDKINEYTVKPCLSESGECETVNAGAERKIVYIDYGATVPGLINELTKRNCEIITVPPSFTCDEILSLKPDGIVLGNGAGNPADYTAQIEIVRSLIGKTPIFAVSLGHQILALASGGVTYKLKHGHRGESMPVRSTEKNRVYITSQNHGFAVDAKSVSNALESFANVNDLSNEGMEYENKKAFSVQFIPCVSNNELDTSWLYDKFIALTERNV